MFQGVYTALVTPFTAEGKIDFSALEMLIEKQIKAGIDGFVLLGTTAEAATLNNEEKKAVLSMATSQINHRTKIIIGTGTNCTHTTLQQTEQALTYQPDGVLVVTPYYNKPNPSGLIEHYRQVASLAPNIVLYHIPGRTGLTVSTQVINDLLQAVPQIKAIKESDYNLSTVTDKAVLFSDKINYLCGNDDLFLQYLSIHCTGIISAAANVLAPAFVKIYQYWKENNPQKSFSVFAQAYPLIKACYAETNPTCVKYLLERLGIGTQTVRLPLGEVSIQTKQAIDAVLRDTDKTLLI